MSIASVEVVPYALPFKEPYVTARGTLERREMVLLRLRDEDGVEGLGEAVPLSLRGGATLESVVAELRAWDGSWVPPPEATGSPGDFSHPSRCAIDTALLDLRSRQAKTPACRELGASLTQPVACNATLVSGKPAEVAATARQWLEDGFTSFKVKVGVPQDREQVVAVRREVGEGALLRVDANAAWTTEEAIDSLRAMEAEGVFLCEQPCPTLEDMAEVGQAVDLWLAGDESIESIEDADRAVAIEACGLASVKLSKVGGPLAAVLVGGSIPTYMSSALDGPVGIAAAAHTALALRERGSDAGIPHGLATQRLFADTVASVECELRGDMLHLPEGSGLGVEIDEAALARHRL